MNSKSNTDNTTQSRMYDYEHLRAAILRQAVKDYKVALKKRDLAITARLERFFMSEYGQLLSYNHGEYIIDNTKRIIAQQRNIKARKGKK